MRPDRGRATAAASWHSGRWGGRARAAEADERRAIVGVELSARRPTEPRRALSEVSAFDDAVAALAGLGRQPVALGVYVRGPLRRVAGEVEKTVGRASRDERAHGRELLEAVARIDAFEPEAAVV